VLVRDEAAKLAGEIAELRHAIHSEPEIGLDLPKTQRKVLDALAGLPLEVSTGKAVSSVTAVLRGGRPGPVVLLRGDMDALPVTEETGLPYASAIPGAMHAAMVHSTIANGRTVSIDISAAEKVSGVLAVFTHRNLPRMNPPSMRPSLCPLKNTSAFQLIPSKSNQRRFPAWSAGSGK